MSFYLPPKWCGGVLRFYSLAFRPSRLSINLELAIDEPELLVVRALRPRRPEDFLGFSVLSVGVGASGAKVLWTFAALSDGLLSVTAGSLLAEVFLLAEGCCFLLAEGFLLAKGFLLADGSPRKIDCVLLYD